MDRVSTRYQTQELRTQMPFATGDRPAFSILSLPFPLSRAWQEDRTEGAERIRIARWAKETVVRGSDPTVRPEAGGIPGEIVWRRQGRHCHPELGWRKLTIWHWNGAY